MSVSKLYLYKQIVQAKIFIDRNYSEPIDLNNIANEAYFSKYHFIRLFKSIYARTPHQYLMHVRMENAKILLQRGLMVNEVCALVGVNSLTSFTALFKRFEKLSPSSYRKIYQERNEQIANQPLKFIPNCFAESKGWKNSNFQEVE